MKWFKTVFLLVICTALVACKAEAAPLFGDGDMVPEMKEGAIYVDIRGAIRNPGVYKVKRGSRLIHLVEMSGGFKSEASTEHLVLSEPLEDGKVYVIPSVHDENTPGSSPEEESGKEDPEADVELVCINTAPIDDLTGLPGIGPATAQAIIDHRDTHGPFKTLGALMDVRNIGEKTFEDLEDLITLQP